MQVATSAAHARPKGKTPKGQHPDPAGERTLATAKASRPALDGGKSAGVRFKGREAQFLPKAAFKAAPVAADWLRVQKGPNPLNRLAMAARGGSKHQRRHRLQMLAQRYHLPGTVKIDGVAVKG